MSKYSSIYPSDSDRKKPLQSFYVDDSDDEKLVGPPKLSNFGTALLSEKENEQPIELGKVTFPSSNGEFNTKLRSSNNEHLSGNYNQTTLGQTYASTHFGEPSQSTMFTQTRRNQQPSMTTINANELDVAINADFENSFRKIKHMQQSMREELTSRHAERRSRRFLNSTRISVLGPAKRASSTNAGDLSDLSVENIDNGNFGTPYNGEVVEKEDPNPDDILNEDTYKRRNEAMNKLKSPQEEQHINTQGHPAIIEFGNLNPVQYLKKHNLPSTELPLISRLYFERQKAQNRQVALQKHSSSREALNNRIARSFSSTSDSANSLNREYSAPAMNPRRKPSDTSVSSTSKTTFQKALSSPLISSSSKFALVDHPNHSKTTTNKEDLKNPYAIPAQNTLNSSYRKREALANIDINRSTQEFFQQSKRFKPLKDSVQPIEGKEQPSSENRENFSHRNPPKPPSIKRVEIVEPKNSRGQSKRSVVRVNEVEYEKIELLGRGGSSKVYKVRDSGNKIYALKRVVFDEFDDSSVDGFKGEIELLKKLENQRRVVKLVDYEMEHGVLYLIMECGDHDLSQILNERAGMSLDIEFVRYHAREMLRCVKVVHDSGIVHSDLKPANFVFVKGILKIIDFGIANAVPDHTVNIYRETQIGTPNYMAPEALIAMNYANGEEKLQQQNRWKVGKPSDIWSCGCIIYQMIYGRPPYGGFQGQNRLLAIMNPDVKIIFSDKTSNEETIPRSALDVMKTCLIRNPEKRCTVDEVLESSFLKPVMVTPFFIRDLIKNAVRYGADQKEISKEKVEELADDVLNRLVDFRL